MAQEAGAPGWDPAYDGGGFDPESAVILMAAALVGYGLWRVVGWQLEVRRERVHWNRLRIWWPTGMLLFGGIVAGVLRSGAPVVLREGLGGLFIALNIPFALVLGLCGPMAQGLDLPDWVTMLLCGLLLWLVNYLLVCAAEARAWANVSTSLGLREGK